MAEAPDPNRPMDAALWAVAHDTGSPVSRAEAKLSDAIADGRVSALESAIRHAAEVGVAESSPELHKALALLEIVSRPGAGGAPGPQTGDGSAPQPAGAAAYVDERMSCIFSDEYVLPE